MALHRHEILVPHIVHKDHHPRVTLFMAELDKILEENDILP
jgi:hypothetical protein